VKCECHDYINQMISPEKVLDHVEASLKEKKSLSLVRFGHGEICYLSWPFNKDFVLDFEYWRLYAGFHEPPENVYPKLLEALNETDIAGLPPEDDWDNPLWDDRMCKVLHYFDTSPKMVSSSYISQNLIWNECFWALLREYRLCLIGRRACEGVKEFNEKGVEVTEAVGLEPNELEQSHSYLSSKKDWDIALVSAGYPGKLITPKLSKTTKRVVIDFGHSLDLLIEGEEIDWDQLIYDWHNNSNPYR